MLSLESMLLRSLLKYTLNAKYNQLFKRKGNEEQAILETTPVRVNVLQLLRKKKKKTERY